MPAMSKIANTAAVLVAAFATQAIAHTYVKEFECGGKTYSGFYAADKSGGDDSSPAWRTDQGWGFQPVMGDQINGPDIIAHMNAEPSPFTAPVEAGSDVKFTWQHDGECQANEVGWDCSHHGWTATWLAPCNGDCAQVDKTNLSFFKIHQAGLMNYPEGTRYAEGGERENTGYWGTDEIFYKNGNTQTVTIPKDLPSGNYVLRTEVASIHNNGDVSQRQFWPQALNIAIQNGNDNAEIPAGIKATEIYTPQDKQLTFDLYQHEPGVTFDAPGPALAPCAAGGSGSGSGSGSAPSSSAAAEAPASTPAPVESSSAAAPAVPVESGYDAQPAPEAQGSTPTFNASDAAVYATATATQAVYVTAPAGTTPEATAAPEAPEEGDNEYEEGDDEEGEDVDEEGDDEDEEYGDYEEGDDEEAYSDEEEGNYGEPQAWGGEYSSYRSHARDFTP